MALTMESKAAGDTLQQLTLFVFEIAACTGTTAQDVFHFAIKLAGIRRTPCRQKSFRMFRYAHRILPSAVCIANTGQFSMKVGEVGGKSYLSQDS